MSGLPPATSDMARVIHVPATEFSPAEIPAGDVIEGSPLREMGAVHTSADGSKFSAVTRVSRGRFFHDQPYHETRYLISGHVALTTADGSVIDLRAGDLIHLEPGGRWELNVIERVLDFFVLSAPDGKPLGPDGGNLPPATRDMAHVVHVPATTFGPAQIPPDDVIGGSPVMESGAEHTSADGTKMSAVSRVEPGSFYFDQHYHETSYFLSGHMANTMADGSIIDLRAGDLIHMEPGGRWQLAIDEPVVDLGVVTSTDGGPVTL